MLYAGQTAFTANIPPFAGRFSRHRVLSDGSKLVTRVRK